MATNRGPETSDDIVARYIAGDAAAGNELASICLARVWRMVSLACVYGSEAEDIVQSTLVQALDKLPSYRGPGTFPAWLDRVTINTIRGHFRRRPSWRLFLGVTKFEELPSTDTERPDRLAEGRRLLNRLAIHMQTIRLKDRLALVLSLIQGRSAAEIAETLGCSTEAARMRLSRARRELASRLAQDVYCEQILEELEK